MTRKQPQRPEPPRQHYTVDMDMEENARPVTLDARSLTLPSVAVIAVVMSSVALTYFISQERTRIDNRIDTVLNSVERLAVSIKQLADGVKFGSTDRYTRAHHDLFCARAEILNKGWKCPPSNDVVTESTTVIRGTMGSVQDEMDEVTKKLQRAKPNATE